MNQESVFFSVVARILGREKTYGRQIAPRHWTVGFKLEICIWGWQITQRHRSLARATLSWCVRSDASLRDHDKSPRRVIGLTWYWHWWWISLISLWLASECWGRQRFKWWRFVLFLCLGRVCRQLSVDWRASSPDIRSSSPEMLRFKSVLLGHIYLPVSMTPLDTLWLPRVSMYGTFDIPTREVWDWNISSSIPLFWRLWRVQWEARRTLFISYLRETSSLSVGIKEKCSRTFLDLTKVSVLVVME